MFLEATFLIVESNTNAYESMNKQTTVYPHNGMKQHGKAANYRSIHTHKKNESLQHFTDTEKL